MITGMNITVVRHAITEFNEQGISNGRYDEDLSVNGREQAKKISGELSKKQFDAVYSSPLKRAVQTIEPLLKTKAINPILDDRLMEIDIGAFSCKPYEDVTKAFGKSMPDMLDEYKYDFRDYGGESSDQVKERVQNFISDLQAKPYNKVLIVTHGGVLRWFNYLIIGEKLPRQLNGTQIDYKI